MMPGNYPLNLYHGDSYEWQFKLWLDEGKTQPLDLTDVTAKAELRDKPGGPVVVPLDCSIQLPNIVTAALTAQVCQTLVVGKMVWDLQLTYATSGAVNTVLAGPVTITADVTDSTYVAPTIVRAPRMVTSR